jgi:hypothetical protein
VVRFRRLALSPPSATVTFAKEVAVDGNMLLRMRAKLKKLNRWKIAARIKRLAAVGVDWLRDYFVYWWT